MLGATEIRPHPAFAAATSRSLRVGIAGLGAIGAAVAHRLDQGVPGLALAAVGTRELAKARAFSDALGTPVAVVPIGDLAVHADVVVDCTPSATFREVARPAVEAGRRLVTSSVGALLQHMDLIERAAMTGAQIVVPSGALLGLDAVTAAAEGNIRSVRMVTRKPVEGLAGAPYLVANGICIDGLSEPLQLFAGSARDAAAGFPANVNVAVALALAGIGADRTTIEIWADPALTRNTHRIEVEADSASFTMTIENIPSENPKTGRITALSVIATLRKMTSPLRVGT